MMISIRVTSTAVNDTNNGLFTYSHQFRHRWTQLFLRSGLLTVKPGQETALEIDGMTVRLRLPLVLLLLLMILLYLLPLPPPPLPPTCRCCRRCRCCYCCCCLAAVVLHCPDPRG